MAKAGVLYVWSSRALSRAIDRSSEAGVHRPEALIDPTRSTAAGERRATHNPPSAAKTFCGAK